MTLPTYRVAFRAFQREYFGKVFAAVDGNVSRAARIAGLNRPHLHSLLRALGVTGIRKGCI